MNNKGFTLVELIATIAIIALIATVSVPAVNSVVNNSKQKNYEILISNIKTAAKAYYEECDFNKAAISSICTTRTITLKNLAAYGFLNAKNKSNCVGEDCITIKNPVNNREIGSCKIKVEKILDGTNYKTTYKITAITGSYCPTNSDYED